MNANPKDWYLIRVLQAVGSLSLLAFVASVMPTQWIVEAGQWLGFDPFPDSPLTFYLARNLSLLYGYIGVLLLIVSWDLERYRPLVWYIAVGTMSFGLLQLVVDSMSSMPRWWTVAESVSTFLGGVLLFFLGAKKS